MRKVFLVILLIFFSISASSLFLSDGAGFYCDRDIDECKEAFSTVKEEANYREYNLKFFNETDLPEIGEYEGYYPEKYNRFFLKEDFNKSELKAKKGCWETKIDEEEIYYTLDWNLNLDQHHCSKFNYFSPLLVVELVTDDQITDLYQVNYFNLYKNPIWFIFNTLWSWLLILLGTSLGLIRLKQWVR